MAYLGRPVSAEISVTGSTDTFTGDGGVTFNLSRTVKDNNPSLLEVFVSNVQQQPTVTYSVAGNVLTFTTAPGAGEPIYVTYRDYNAAPFFTVPDGAITAVKLANDSVAESKIATGAVTENKIAANAVTTAKISGIIPPEKGGTGINSVGTTGNVLTSNGTAWISKELVIPAAPNGFVSVQVFDTPGNVTWTKPADLVRIKVTVVGAGGSGGRSGQPGSYGGGGGGGGTAIVFLPAPSIPGPVTVTVGEGRAKPPGVTNGFAGNTSSFGSFCSATGGASNQYGPSIGGIGSGGNVNIRGGAADLGGVPPTQSSQGAPSFLGGQGNNGGGGGGGGGPAPGNGIVVVEEFF